MIFLKEFWPWSEFERFRIFSTIELKGEVKFLIRELLEVCYFPSDFMVVAEKF